VGDSLFTCPSPCPHPPRRVLVLFGAFIPSFLSQHSWTLLSGETALSQQDIYLLEAAYPLHLLQLRVLSWPSHPAKPDPIRYHLIPLLHRSRYSFPSSITLGIEYRFLILRLWSAMRITFVLNLRDACRVDTPKKKKKPTYLHIASLLRIYRLHTHLWFRPCHQCIARWSR
jgi:hypothetical protein